MASSSVWMPTDDGTAAPNQLPRRTAVPVIAQIGRFDPWKGLDRTVAVYRQVREEKKCQLVIAGGAASDDPESGRILNWLYELTNGDEDIHILNLSLANRLENYAEVNALQRAATVVMQPSTREGFGLVVAEALWKGKPVIAGNVGGMKFQIRNGKTGYFYQSPKVTADRIKYLLENPSAAEKIGIKGKEFVRDRFMMVDRMIDYLRAIGITKGSASGGLYPESITSFYPW